MNMGLQNKKSKLEKIKPRELKKTIGYSISGLVSFYCNEKSSLLHLIASIIVILCCFFLHVNYLEVYFIIFLLVLILSVELLNSAIEAVCDLVSLEYNKLIKVAKDCGSAATFILSIFTFITIIIIFIPHIIELMR
jgi:diacylglycerol kinase